MERKISNEKELLIPGGIIEGVGLGVMFVTLITNVSEISKEVDFSL